MITWILLLAEMVTIITVMLIHPEFYRSVQVVEIEAYLNLPTSQLFIADIYVPLLQDHALKTVS